MLIESPKKKVLLISSSEDKLGSMAVALKAMDGIECSSMLIDQKAELYDLPLGFDVVAVTTGLFTYEYYGQTLIDNCSDGFFMQGRYAGLMNFLIVADGPAGFERTNLQTRNIPYCDIKADDFEFRFVHLVNNVLNNLRSIESTVKAAFQART